MKVLIFHDRSLSQCFWDLPVGQIPIIWDLLLRQCDRYSPSIAFWVDTQMHLPVKAKNKKSKKQKIESEDTELTPTKNTNSNSNLVPLDSFDFIALMFGNFLENLQVNYANAKSLHSQVEKTYQSFFHPTLYPILLRCKEAATNEEGPR